MLTESINDVLSELARRARGTDSPDEGFTPMINVVADVGHALVAGDREALRETLPFFAAAREHVEYDGVVEHSPYLALSQSEKAPAYLAGALWACSAVINTFIERGEAIESRADRRAGRVDVQRGLLELLRSRGTVRPKDVIGHLSADGPEPSASLVSVVVGDLIADGMVEPAGAPDGADRRGRWYRLADEGAVAPAEVMAEARVVVQRLRSYVDDEELAGILGALVDEPAGEATR